MTEEVKNIQEPTIANESTYAKATADMLIKPQPKPRAKPGRKPAQPVMVVEPKPTLAEVVAPVIAPKTKRQLHEERMHKMWLEDSKLVRGIFRNHEVPGAALEFDIRLYKEDQLKTYKLLDGQVTEIPRGIARHINNNCNYPQHKYMADENGKQQVVVGLKIQRYSFNPIDFSDVGSDKPDIVIVTPV